MTTISWDMACEIAEKLANKKPMTEIEIIELLKSKGFTFSKEGHQ